MGFMEKLKRSSVGPEGQLSKMLSAFSEGGDSKRFQVTIKKATRMLEVLMGHEYFEEGKEEASRL